MTRQVISLYSAGTREPVVAFKPKVYKGKNNTEKEGDPQECLHFGELCTTAACLCSCI